MQKTYTFDINDLADTQYDELRRLLFHNGITFDQIHTDFGLKTIMTVNAEKLDHMNRRSAGPKEKGLYLTGSPSDPIYVSEIRQLQKDGYSMHEIANMYNVSRATLYRRIAEARKTGSDQII